MTGFTVLVATLVLLTTLAAGFALPAAFALGLAATFAALAVFATTLVLVTVLALAFAFGGATLLLLTAPAFALPLGVAFVPVRGLVAGLSCDFLATGFDLAFAMRERFRRYAREAGACAF